MANLTYSNEALNIKSKFFRAKSIIYVEGDDDILFWKEIFSKNSTHYFEFEKVGGKEEIKKYIEKIKSKQIKSIVATDSDLDFENKTKNNLILYSFGHSIENTIYTSKLITDLCNSFLKENYINEKWCEEWLSRNSEKLTPIIILDIANELACTGLDILGSNCERFLDGKSSFEISEDKVSNFYRIKSQLISNKFITKAESIVDEIKQKDNLKYFIRGHFLSNLTHKMISLSAQKKGKKVSISNESLYAAAIMGIKSHFNRSHPHFNYYKNNINNILRRLDV